MCNNSTQMANGNRVGKRLAGFNGIKDAQVKPIDVPWIGDHADYNSVPENILSSRHPSERNREVFSSKKFLLVPASDAESSRHRYPKRNNRAEITVQ